MAANKEVVSWIGTSSQLVNIVPFIIATLMICTLVLSPVGLLIAIWYYLVVKNMKYEVTTERLKIHAGVLNKTSNDIELYRVKDLMLFEPWYLRFFNLGHVIIHTSDLSHPTVLIRAVKHAKEVRELLRTLTEERRKNRGVASLDVI